MNWIVGACVVLLVCGLAMLFVKSAQIIRRDVNARFHQLADRLESRHRGVARFTGRPQRGVERIAPGRHLRQPAGAARPSFAPR